MDKDVINDRTYFYYDDSKKIEVQKQILQHEWGVLLKNFDSVTFDLVYFLKSNNQFFPYKHPNNHPNILLEFSNQSFQYYYSFPFSSNNDVLNTQYYDFLSNNDFKKNRKYQYWRPFISSNNRQFVKINKFNINPDNYILENDLRFKIYNILKLYIKK